MNLKDHLEKLRYFFEVAKAGSVKVASERLYITQPSVTKSIRILENAVGRELFYRRPRGMELTKEGEKLLTYCHQLFSSLNDLELSLESPDDPMAGALKVGTYDSIAIYFWPKFLRSFLPKYPKLNLELSTGRSFEIQEMVEKGELDLGLIVNPQATDHLEVIELTTDDFHLFEAGKKKTIYNDNDYAPLIYMPDALKNISQTSLEGEIFRDLELEKRKLYKTSSLESAKELAINGIGMALLPKKVTREEVKRNRLVQVKRKGFPSKGIARHQIGVTYSQHRKDTEILCRLIEALKNHEW